VQEEGKDRERVGRRRRRGRNERRRVIGAKSMGHDCVHGHGMERQTGA
jgi:hypothetical protein